MQEEPAITPPRPHDATTSPPQATRATLKLMRRAILDFDLISPGDRVAVGMSGGKDSALLLCALRELSLANDLAFSVHPLHLDQRQPGFDRHTFLHQQEHLGMAYEVIEEDTHSVVQARLKPGQIPCSICARMRRGILNRACQERGYTKLALGHHLDDALETFFLNLLYGRKLDPLKPATPATEYDVVTIRPMILVEERKVHAWVVAQEVHVVACPVCDTTPESRRRDLKALLGGFGKLNADLYASTREALYGEGRGERGEDDERV